MLVNQYMYRGICFSSSSADLLLILGVNKHALSGPSDTLTASPLPWLLDRYQGMLSQIWGDLHDNWGDAVGIGVEGGCQRCRPPPLTPSFSPFWGDRGGGGGFYLDRFGTAAALVSSMTIRVAGRI